MAWKLSKRQQSEHKQPGIWEMSLCRLPSSLLPCSYFFCPSPHPAPKACEHETLKNHRTSEEPWGATTEARVSGSRTEFLWVWSDATGSWITWWKSEVLGSTWIRIFEREPRAFAFITSFPGDPWLCIIRFEGSCSRKKTVKCTTTAGQIICRKDHI